MPRAGRARRLDERAVHAELQRHDVHPRQLRRQRVQVKSGAAARQRCDPDAVAADLAELTGAGVANASSAAVCTLVV